MTDLPGKPQQPQPGEPTSPWAPPSDPNQPQDPYGQDAHAHSPLAQDPYNQSPYGQNPHPQGPYAQNPYHQDPYNQNPVAQDPYNQNPYGQGAPGSFAGAPGSQATLTSWIRRVGSHVVDWAPYGILQNIADPMVGGWDAATSSERVGTNPPLGWALMALALAWAFYNSVYRDGTTGVSVGRQLLGTKLVSEATGQPLGMGRAFLRQVAHLIDTVICLVGYLFPLWDSKRQTIADKVVKSVVIDTK